MKSLIKYLFIFTVSIYQDRLDATRSIVVIEHDGIEDHYPVDNKDLNETFINKVVNKYGDAESNQSKKPSRILPRK